jgi:EAL and modified HD-GYP domain-containing signal transduction protein
VGQIDRYMVGRQPIFDRNREVFGYELLFRGVTGSGLSGQTPSGESMTSDVLVRIGLDCGLPAVVGDRAIFVVAPRSFITGDFEIPFAADRVVCEIPNSEVRDDELLEGCKRLLEADYTLCLTNYDWRDGDEKFLEVVSMVKMDSHLMLPADLQVRLDKLKGYDVRTIASRVETHGQLRECQEIGFDLFQGYVLSRPEVVQGNALSPQRTTLLRLVDKISDPEVDTPELGAVVESDPGLAQRLLRLAGAGAGSGMRRGVKSIREAVVLLGRQQLRSWIFLMLTSDARGAIPEQVGIALTRAKMCELIAKECVPDERESAFTVGLVSALDLILETPLGVIVEQMGLADHLEEALVEHVGDLGRILADVLAWEIGLTWLRSPLEPGVIERTYLEALAWTNSMFETLAEAA